MRINHNLPALSAYNNLSKMNGGLAGSINKLSSGLRINDAADDAAGLAISEKMRAQIRGLEQAERNAQDGISMLQTAGGALEESTSILQRMRELAVQSANDTLTQQDRSYIQLEVNELKDELDRISTTTQFNKKKLLDGSADVLWSCSTLDAGLTVRGGVSGKDEFGQDVTGEGNYRVHVAAIDAGKGQALKSNIFSLGEDDSGVTVVAGKSSRLNEVSLFYENGVFLLQDPQTITVTLGNGKNASFTLYGDDSIGSMGDKFAEAIKKASDVYVEGSPAQFVGENVVIGPNAKGGTKNPILKGLATYWLDGAAQRISSEYGLSVSDKELEVKIISPEIGGGTLASASYTGAEPDKVTLNISELDALPATLPNGESRNGSAQYDDRVITHEMVHAYVFMDDNLRASIANSTEGAWLVEGLAEYIHGANARVDGDAAANITTELTNVLNNNNVPTTSAGYSAAYLAVRYFDENSGGTGIKGLLDELKAGRTVDAAIAASSSWADKNDFETAIAGDIDAYITQVKAEDSSLDTGAIGGQYASGGPALSPESVIGGNGIYSVQPLKNYGWTVKWPESMGDVDALSSALSVSAPRADTLQSVEGTLLLHSPLTGDAGNISIACEEKVLKALGFAEVREARETVYSVSVFDAHTSESLANNVKVSGGTVSRVLHDNVDIELKNNFAIKTNWNGTMSDGYGGYKFESIDEGEDFVVHIADNSTVLQIGANEGEDMTLNFGCVDSASLGVDTVNMASHELASRAVSIIDGALDMVNSMRSRLGAYQNRLEHTVTNLTTASENLTASESRIRDLDMAHEMINFTKLNILSQAGTSMLGQANQLTQNVLQLLQ